MTAGKGQAILRVEGLTKEFFVHERSQRLQVLDRISFEVRTGELVSLVGASGSGKSSILKCIHRTYLPTAGQVQYCTREGDWVDLATADEATILRLRRGEMRFVSQFLRVLPRRSALQVVANTLREHGLDSEKSESSARDFLFRVGLPERLWNIPPHTFSGGEKQIVNLAQALVVNPRLLLLDEPTASLDPKSTEQVLGVIEELKSSDIAILSVFHDQRIIERLADTKIEVQGGLPNQPRLGTG